MHGLRGRRHLPAWKTEELMQGLRGQQHLSAWKGEKQMQGLRGRQHLPTWKGEKQMQGLQERRHFRGKRRIKTSVGQQRSKRSVFQGDCGRGACGRRRRERESKEEGVYAGGGMRCERGLMCARKCGVQSKMHWFAEFFAAHNPNHDGIVSWPTLPIPRCKRRRA